MAGQFAIRIRTQMSYEDVEAMLTKHCQGAFEIGFEGLEERDGGNRKVMILHFETEADRDAFRNALSRK